MSVYLRLENISLSESDYDITMRDSDKMLLDNINLMVEKGEIFGILGPTNCGKTMLLKTIAGLIKPSSGTVYINREDVTRMKPHERGLTMVFQNFVLYPYMTGIDNISFLLKQNLMKEYSDKETAKLVEERVYNTIRMLGFDDANVLYRYPQDASVGQKQRIALARGIVLMPNLLLLDEPLLNVEENLRNEIRHNLKKLLKKNNITCLYVSHNQKELGEVCDNIAVLNEGVIQQIGTYQELYSMPTTLFVSTLIGEAMTNYISPAKMNELTNGAVKYHMTIRYSDCILTDNKESIENGICIGGEIEFVESLIQDNTKIVFFRYDNELFGIETSIMDKAEIGDRVFVVIPFDKAMFYDTEPEKGKNIFRRIYNLW